MGLISTFLSFAIPALILITIVVFIHELGHFLVARWCGVKVQTFSIGFGKEFFGFTDKHGTRWCFARWPLGGYVRFIDDENAASAPSKTALEGMSEDQRAGAFQSKPLWQRSAVVLAGPAFNIISAAMFMVLAAWWFGVRDAPSVAGEVEQGSAAARAGIERGDRIIGINGGRIAWMSDVNRIVVQSAGVPLTVEFERSDRRYTATLTPAAVEMPDPLGGRTAIGDIGIRVSSMVGEVLPGGPAEGAGLKVGDRIVAIDAQPARQFIQLQRIVSASPGKPLRFDIERDGRPMTIAITPRADKVKDAAGKEVEVGRIGVAPARTGLRHFGAVEAVSHGIQETAGLCWQVIKGIPKLPSAIFKAFSLQPQNDLGGPVAIVELTGNAAKGGLSSFIGWIAIFSIILGVMNLLPIPLLDGGHLVFYALEAVRGRPLSERVQEIAFKVGIVVIMTMMTAAFLGDATRKFNAWFGLG